MFKHYFELVQNVAIYPIISLIIFFGFFVLMLIYMLRLKKSYVQKMKELPLELDPEEYPDQSNYLNSYDTSNA